MHPWLAVVFFNFTLGATGVRVGECTVPIPNAVRSVEPRHCSLNTYSGDAVGIYPFGYDLGRVSVMRWDFDRNASRFCDLTYADTVAWMQCGTHDVRLWDWFSPFVWTFENHALTVGNESIVLPGDWDELTDARVGPVDGVYVTSLGEFYGGQVVSRARNPTLCGQLVPTEIDRRTEIRVFYAGRVSGTFVLGPEGGRFETTYSAIAESGCATEMLTSQGLPT